MSFKSIFRDDLFAGQVAIVSGGGSGIGRCIAHELAALGAEVVLASRTLEKLEGVKQEIQEAGGKAHTFVCNIRKEEEVKALMAHCVEEYGGVHLLVNNAGGQFMAPPETISLKGWHAVVETNLTGTFSMCKAAHDAWMGKHGGSIVNIVANFRNGMPLMAHTSAARAGVSNLGKSLSLAWAHKGIRVNSIAPGIILSSGLKNYPPHIVSMVKESVGNIPVKRLGTESEISAATAYLLSPAAAFICGETLRIDGAAALYRQMAPVYEHDKNTPFNGFHLSADLPDEI